MPHSPDDKKRAITRLRRTMPCHFDRIFDGLSEDGRIAVTADFCASNRMRLSDSMACSSARMDLSRPTNSGITMCGNTTTSRSGSTGRTRRSWPAWECSVVVMRAPVSGPAAGCAGTATVMGLPATGCKRRRRMPVKCAIPRVQRPETARPPCGGLGRDLAGRLIRPKRPSAAAARSRTRRSCRSGRARTCARSPTRPPPPC